MKSPQSSELRIRVEERITAWQVTVERLTETESSVLVFGYRENQPVVLKVIKHQGDEWRSGEVLDAFGGIGVVTVIDYIDGALLLERILPGDSLVNKSLSSADDEATTVLAETIKKMSPRAPACSVPTVEDWGKGFERYAASGDDQILKDLVSKARRMYFELCESQKQVRLLHGDLHHYNVLFDNERGWLAIDPKGVIGEVEYEIGAALRNPVEIPVLFSQPSVIRKRVDVFVRTLGVNSSRVLLWAFAQAVLSAIWTVEDGFELEPQNAGIVLANSLFRMLDSPRSHGGTETYKGLKM